MTTSAEDGSDIVMEAAHWHDRLDAPDMDWDAFAEWLDTDPAHRKAYESVALLDADIDDCRDGIMAALPANDIEPDLQHDKHRRRWWIVGGTAVAAVIALMLMPRWAAVEPDAMIAYRTGPTETRTIALKDGSHILLDRNSRLALADGGSPRIEMQAGAAYFDIRHDPSRSLVISAGNYEVRDVGTTFDVAMTPQRLSVAVSEGRLTVGPSYGKGTTVAAGQRIDVIATTGEASVKPVNIADVGAWRGGQLVYQDTPLALVAMDISRYVGRPVEADPEIGDIRVSGVFAIGDGTGLIRQIEALLPVRAVESHGTLRLVDRGDR